MADAADVLVALDFDTPIVLCGGSDCWLRASRLVGCKTSGCPKSWIPACSIHLHATLSSSRPAMCTGCKAAGPVSSILTSRPL